MKIYNPGAEQVGGVNPAAVSQSLAGLTNELARLLDGRSFDDLDGEEAVSAVEIMRSLGKTLDWISSVAGLLKDVLRSEDETARTVAAGTLARLKGEDEKAVVAVLGMALAGGDTYCRRVAAEALGHLGAEGGRLLSTALADPDEWVRHFALQAGVQVGPHATPAIPMLIEILRQEDGPESDEIPQVYHQMDACDVLREIGPAAREAVPHLTAVMSSPAVEVDRRWLRLRAAHALTRITGDPSPTIEVAVEALDDPEWWLRSWACDLLAEFGRGDEAVAERLSEAAEDDDEIVRRSASKALRAVPG